MTAFYKALVVWAFLPLFITAQDFDDPDRDLFYAIFDNNVNAVTKALKKKADLTSSYTYERYGRECHNWTPIHAAAAIGNKEVIELLLKKGANMEAMLPNGSDGEALAQGLFTPLHIAAGYGSLEAAKLLIEKGVKVDAKANWNRTPLISAISSNERENTEMVKLLIEAGADINVKHSNDATPLFDAAGWGKKEIAKLLLEKGADPNALSADCAPYAAYEVTPIFCAIWQHHGEMLQILLDHGAMVNTPNLKSSPLHQAAQFNDLEAAAFLVKNNADRAMKDEAGKTALDIAKEKDNAAMIYLLETGRLRPTDEKIFSLFKEDAFKRFKLMSKEAPAFSFKDMNGNIVSSDALAGKVILLNVWATWCGPCVKEMPSFNKLLEAVGRENVVLVAVSIDRNIGVVKDFIQRNKYSFTYLHDPEAKVRDLFGGAVPATFIINKKGELVAQVDGSIDWDKKAIKELLQILADYSEGNR